MMSALSGIILSAQGADPSPLSGNFKGKTVLGIYQVEGEELKICLPKQGDKERPSDFKSPEGSDLAFMTFKRSPSAAAHENHANIFRKRLVITIMKIKNVRGDQRAIIEFLRLNRTPAPDAAGLEIPDQR